MSKPYSITTPFGIGCNDTKLRVMASDEIDALYTEYFHHRGKHIPIEYIGRLTNFAAKMLSGKPTAELARIYNGSKLSLNNDYNYEFIKDTLKFIETGHRPMSIKVRSQLIEFHSEGTVKLNPLDKLKPRKDRYTLDSTGTGKESDYCKWLKQPLGVYDMLCTLVILFGTRNNLLLQQK